MRTVYKYEILGATTVLPMPAGAQLLSVHNQHERICVWALVDTEAPEVERVFRLVGTGHPYDDEGGTFVGSVLMQDGYYVFHVFDHGERS